MRRIAVLDAPSNLGLRPPTASSVPGCAKAPGALRDHGLVARLNARDAGCITPARFDPAGWQPGDGVAQSEDIAIFTKRLADRIGTILAADEFPLVLGGDCSILLGAGLAMRRHESLVDGRIGLVYVDGHSDFRHQGNASYVGAAAGEALALSTGRGQPNLAAIEHRRPYFRDVDVVLLGIRTHDEYRLDLQAAGIATRAVPELRSDGAARSAQWARTQLSDCAAYWVHVDVDVLDPAVMPAVDAPDVGGIAYTELELLLQNLVSTPKCLGVQLTVFDPDYDPDTIYARELTDTVVAGLSPLTTPPPPTEAKSDEPSPPPGNAPVSIPTAPDAPGPVSAAPDAPAPVSAPPDAPAPVSAPPDAPAPVSAAPDALVADPRASMSAAPDAPASVSASPDSPTSVSTSTDSRAADEPASVSPGSLSPGSGRLRPVAPDSLTAARAGVERALANLGAARLDDTVPRAGRLRRPPTEPEPSQHGDAEPEAARLADAEREAARLADAEPKVARHGDAESEVAGHGDAEPGAARLADGEPEVAPSANAATAAHAGADGEPEAIQSDLDQPAPAPDADGHPEAAENANIDPGRPADSVVVPAARTPLDRSLDDARPGL